MSKVDMMVNLPTNVCGVRKPFASMMTPRIGTSALFVESHGFKDMSAGNAMYPDGIMNGLAIMHLVIPPLS